VCRFLCGWKFSTPLSRYQGVNYWVVYSKNMFNFVRNCQTVFQSGCTISHQQWMRVPVAPHPHQRSVLPVFCILAIRIAFSDLFFFFFFRSAWEYWKIFSWHSKVYEILFIYKTIESSCRLLSVISIHFLWPSFSYFVGFSMQESKWY